MLHQNDNKNSLKLSRYPSHEEKHKKLQKHNTIHEKWAYPETTELNVSTTPRCNVECQRCKVDVRNELYSIQFMSFDKIKVVTHMPQI